MYIPCVGGQYVGHSDESLAALKSWCDEKAKFWEIVIWRRIAKGNMELVAYRKNEEWHNFGRYFVSFGSDDNHGPFATVEAGHEWARSQKLTDYSVSRLHPV